MASNVSGSGGSGGDPAARLQALYNQKERDMEARHRDELRDLKAENQAEVDRLRRDAKKKIENVQQESVLKLSEKDIQHQKEIENIKQIYSKRVAEAKKSE